ncbi:MULTISPECIES: hypothetical protein [unclassified Streptomyces]|nr:hypothetical protein [Streptomyces sp. NBC_01477]
MELAYGRGSWIPDGTAGVVIVLLMFAFILGMFGWGLWNKHRKGR